MKGLAPFLCHPSLIAAVHKVTGLKQGGFSSFTPTFYVSVQIGDRIYQTKASATVALPEWNETFTLWISSAQFLITFSLLLANTVRRLGMTSLLSESTCVKQAFSSFWITYLGVSRCAWPISNPGIKVFCYVRLPSGLTTIFMVNRGGKIDPDERSKPGYNHAESWRYFFHVSYLIHSSWQY